MVMKMCVLLREMYVHVCACVDWDEGGVGEETGGWVSLVKCSICAQRCPALSV